MEIIQNIEKLSERSQEIDIRKENAIMRDTILKLKAEISERNLTGLAAPQIDVQKRIVVINYSGDMKSYINPVITSVKGMHLSRETCPSIPDKSFIRPRNNEIAVAFQTPLGKLKSEKLIGMAAVVMQELVDHLDGLLLSDIGLEVDEMFDNATEEERDEVLEAYMKSLDMVHAEVEKDIAQDSELKQMDDAAKFMSAVARGEVQLERQEKKKRK